MVKPLKVNCVNNNNDNSCSTTNCCNSNNTALATRVNRLYCKLRLRPHHPTNSNSLVPNMPRSVHLRRLIPSLDPVNSDRDHRRRLPNPQTYHSRLTRTPVISCEDHPHRVSGVSDPHHPATSCTTCPYPASCGDYRLRRPHLDPAGPYYPLRPHLRVWDPCKEHRWPCPHHLHRPRNSFYHHLLNQFLKTTIH